MRISDWSSDVCSSDLWRLPRSILWTLSASDFQTPRATQSGVGAMSVDHVRIGVSGPCQTASPTSIGYVPSPRPEASKSIAARGQRMEVGFRSVIGLLSEGDRKSVVWGKIVSVRVDLSG